MFITLDSLISVGALHAYKKVYMLVYDDWINSKTWHNISELQDIMIVLSGEI